MILQQSLYHTFQRYRTLQTGTITALPIVILMPHSACNCRCVMCDIWKGNKNLKQLTEADVNGLLQSLERLGTKQVLMSGGEALLNANFFALCRMIRKKGIKITMLSTGILLKKHANELVQWIDEIIVSLDGDEETHDRIRNIPEAYSKMKEGIKAVRSLQPFFRISGRSVIHGLNFQVWPKIVDAAKELGLDRISFLPADVSSQAFNRETPWSKERQNEVLISSKDLGLLEDVVERLLNDCRADFESRFIAESPEKIRQIVQYYRAVYGLNPFPFRKCNAPWVSAVVEADGLVRPCFFHEAYGNIKHASLTFVINNSKAIRFREQLNMEQNETCKRCVCSLHLSPRLNPARFL